MRLAIRDLSVGFAQPRGAPPREVLRRIDAELGPGEVLGIVGESGSGKSVLALAVIGLLPRTARARGRVEMDGTDLLPLGDGAMSRIRGRRIGMIFQEPMTALNPAMRVGAQIGEGLRLHRGMGRAEARAEALRLLDRVRIDRAAERLDAFPHELSGGQRQRVGIAIALAPEPELLIADEPTTALDVTVQAELLDILDELVSERALSLILVSHDLGVIARLAERCLVLWRGAAVETGPTARLLADPRHDHTRALIDALPRRTRATLPRSADG
ncbi:ABC transporter ATP-binding protein [Palleronia sediminis]|uniref:ABC transporter ATP-binding protein n=1 Tax=Palleronia sediminis TaxID=2547833 RepID=A0A4R6A4F4_9RHOB|nr:ABC transporter ATP-binding protein [Palleronia sediminis]TDL77695.1 ABC transporter ATP-binding protein [Palleronia sediminis]